MTMFGMTELIGMQKNKHAKQTLMPNLYLILRLDSSWIKEVLHSVSG